MRSRCQGGRWSSFKSSTKTLRALGPTYGRRSGCSGSGSPRFVGAGFALKEGVAVGQNRDEPPLVVEVRHHLPKAVAGLAKSLDLKNTAKVGKEHPYVALRGAAVDVLHADLPHAQVLRVNDRCSSGCGVVC